MTVEPLESRRLLSATPYILSQIGYFGANDTGASPGFALIRDTAGNLFGTTSRGGAYGAGTVFEIPFGTTTIVTLASFNGTNGRFPESTLAQDAAGNLYGTTSNGGTAGDWGTVFEVVKGSDAITNLASFNGTNGGNPGAVALDAAGNVYGTTASTVFEITKGSTTITTLVSFNGTNGTGLSGVTLDAAGNLYGATGNGGAGGKGTVFEILKGSTTVTTLASFNGTNGADPDAGVTLDATGNLYGTTPLGGTSNYGTVFEIAKGANTVTMLASFSGTNGENPSGGVTLDAVGNVYGTTMTGGPGGPGKHRSQWQRHSLRNH